VAGLGYVVMAIARGSTSLVLPQFDPSTLLPWLQSDVTGCFLVPTMVSTLLRHPDVGNSDYARLGSIIYGAAPMSPALLRKAMDTFRCDFYNGFGAGTEAGMQSVLPPEDHRRALAGEEHLLGSIGKPGFGIELRLVDAAMNDVAPGEVGEIVSRSEMVMSGYLGRPDLTAQAVVDGWFRAGDMAWRDDEGYLYLAGRKNDMIIRGGENIYPIEIESTLAEHPAIAEVAVVGAPDEHWGEVVHAHLVALADLDLDELRAFCRERLAGYKVPAAFHVHVELPKNASGKVLKRTLRDLPVRQGEPA
jgi:acyl-CoA synthetase (AMP-forming)/AMP-acid ligase II